MSIKLMQLVWDTELPQSRKFLLLSLADQANDAGECWPSIGTLAARCSMGRRTVFDALAELEADDWLEREQLPGQRVRFKLNLLRLQQLTIDQCESRTGAKSAPVRNLHACANRTGAESGGTGAKSALHKATPSKATPIGGDTRTREQQLEVMGAYDRRLIEPFLDDLPPSIQVQVFADFVKHCQVKRGPYSHSTWRQTLGLLRELEAAGADLNASLRETILLQLVKPVDPRKKPRAAGPPARPRANDDFSQVHYQGSADDDLPPELRDSAAAGA